MSADSCGQTLVIRPTLRSTLVPSGCSAVGAEELGFVAPAIIVYFVVNTTKKKCGLKSGAARHLRRRWKMRFASWRLQR